jgi:aspartyl-tRNA(Asn)/glutamyl-tRNA(Gln) amidotransferase subunit C
MISKEEVQQLATLARLELSDQEIESLQKDMSSILDYVGQLSQVSFDKAQTPPIPPLRNILRDDVPRAEGDPMADKEEAVRAAFPKREGDFNVVRKIIQKDE